MVVGLHHPEWVQVKTGLYCGLVHGYLYALLALLLHPLDRQRP